MASPLPDFKAEATQAHQRLGRQGAARLLDAGRAWNLAPTLRAAGGIIFPHAGIHTCGHQIAAAVHACLDTDADRVLALGVLHGLNPELRHARNRIDAGADVTTEPARGIQGPGLAGREDWRNEFSLDHFTFLWHVEIQRRGLTAPPELILRFPFLVGTRPDTLPGIDDLHAIARDALVVATADPFHHGIGYGTPPELALPPDDRGLALARQRINQGLAILRDGDYHAFQHHCIDVRSDARDTAVLLRELTGPATATILDLVAHDTAASYRQPPPTWVACALIDLRPIEPRDAINTRSESTRAS